MRSRWRRSPLWLRLTASYALLVTATLIVVGGLAYELTRAHLRRSLNDQIMATAGSFRQAVEGAERSRRLGAVAEEWLSIQSLPEGLAAAVRLPSDEVITTSGEPDLVDLAGARSDDLAASTSPRWWELEGPDGGARALTLPVELEDRRGGTLVVAASWAQVRRTLSTLLTGIAWASASGLLFALLAGAAAVRRSVRPLATMSRDIERIQASGDLDTRVSAGSGTDEVVRLTESFNAMLNRLQAAFASQQRFLMDASHELRTPLTIARGGLELLRAQLEDAEARRSAAVVDEELERMKGIVEDLLLLTRLDEGLQLAGEAVDVELVVNEAVLRGALVAPHRVAAECEPELVAFADETRLLQVLTNLVVNASQHGGPQVRVLVTARREKERVVVEVSDDGPGIAKEDLPYVFDRLYRGSSARTTAHKGAGLGLAIALSLVEAMGGRITASSEGRGAVFKVVLESAA